MTGKIWGFTFCTARGLSGYLFWKRHHASVTNTRSVTKGKLQLEATSAIGTAARQQIQGMLDRFRRTTSVMDKVATKLRNCPSDVE